MWPRWPRFRATRRSPAFGRRPAHTATCEGRKDRDDVACGEVRFRSDIATIHEHDTSEIRWNPEAVRDIGDGASFGNLEVGDAVPTVGWKKRSEGGEEPDFDPHLNPPCPSGSTDRL